MIHISLASFKYQTVHFSIIHILKITMRARNKSIDPIWD